MNIKTNNSEKLELALTNLYHVMDPEIDLNIIDLGLVYEIYFDEKSNNIMVEMTLTTQFCPMGESIIESTAQAMKQSFPEHEIHVNLAFEPPWNQSMISEAGLNFLNS